MAPAKNSHRRDEGMRPISKASSHVRSFSRDSSVTSPQRMSKPVQHGNTGSLVNISKQGKQQKQLFGSEKACSSDSEIDLTNSEEYRDKKGFKNKARQRSQQLLDSYSIQDGLLDSSIPYSEDFTRSEEEDSIKTNYENDEDSFVKVMKLKPKFSISENVGFGHLPDQVYKKAVRKGFEFSLMVVGESGLGKSTLVNSMFLTDIYSREESSDILADEQTLQVKTHNRVLEENGVKLALTVVDTPGFGDAVDNTECWQPIIDYVDKQFEDYLEGETRVERVELPDRRVHACLYFIAPTGHGLKPLDIQFMKRIHEKVNIIPVIGKADSCTLTEINLFKTKILVQLERNEIQIYDFPESEVDPGNSWMRSLLPFAVVGSNATLTDEAGNKYRGRVYPWGTVNIEDRDHCDFSPLRHLLLATHMQDLKEVTHAKHYENFRRQKLNVMGGNVEENISENDFSSQEGGKLQSIGFEWERNFGKLTNERLEQLQRYAKTQDFAKTSTGSSNELDSIGRHRNSFMKEKMLWSKPNGASMQELRQTSVGTYLSGKKMRNLMNAINVNK